MIHSKPVYDTPMSREIRKERIKILNSMTPLQAEAILAKPLVHCKEAKESTPNSEVASVDFFIKQCEAIRRLNMHRKGEISHANTSNKSTNQNNLEIHRRVHNPSQSQSETTQLVCSQKEVRSAAVA